MPVERGNDGRVLESAERTVSTRDKIAPRSSGSSFSSEPYQSSPINAPNTVYYPFSGGEGKSPFINGPVISMPQGTGAGVVNYGPVYGDDDPFRIASDVLLRLFGSNPSTDENTSPVVVGDAGGSTGGSFFPILIILGILGAVGYYLYKRQVA